MSDNTTYGLTQQDRDQLLAVHNWARKQVGNAPLVWDDTLASYANQYAQKATTWGHWSQNRTADLPQPCFRDGTAPDQPVVYVTSVATGDCPDGSSPPGENLGMGVPSVEARCYPKCKRSDTSQCGEGKPGEYCPCQGGTKGGCTATNWFTEIFDHRCGQPIAGDHSDCNAPMCGHYTQLVSQLSTRFGCAAARRSSLKNLDLGGGGTAQPSDFDFVVCEYFPHGNIVGKYAFDSKYCDDATRLAFLKNGSALPDELFASAGSAPATTTTAAPTTAPPTTTPPPPSSSSSTTTTDVPKAPIAPLYKNANKKANNPAATTSGPDGKWNVPLSDRFTASELKKATSYGVPQ